MSAFAGVSPCIELWLPCDYTSPFAPSYGVWKLLLNGKIGIESVDLPAKEEKYSSSLVTIFGGSLDGTPFLIDKTHQNVAFYSLKEAWIQPQIFCYHHRNFLTYMYLNKSPYHHQSKNHHASRHVLSHREKPSCRFLQSSRP